MVFCLDSSVTQMHAQKYGVMVITRGAGAVRPAFSEYSITTPGNTLEYCNTSGLVYPLTAFAWGQVTDVATSLSLPTMTRSCLD